MRVSDLVASSSTASAASGPRPLRLIYLTGIDGSGKTPLAHRLVDRLNGMGYDARYVHGVMHGNVLLGPVRKAARAIFMRRSDVHADYKQYRTTMVSASRRHRRLSGLYGVLWFANYCLEMLGSVSLPVRSGSLVVADRYVYDVILRIALATDRPVTSFARHLMAFFLLNARPDHLFLIDVPEEVALEVKSDVHSIEYLRERRTRYLELAERYGFHVLDGLQTPEALLDQIQARCFGASRVGEASTPATGIVADAKHGRLAGGPIGESES